MDSMTLSCVKYAMAVVNRLWIGGLL
uniref:Uncharacterized protein n=1 Tax=Rhizophora mucronata TaxID=61149 RepID=A0A2P2QII2_RHIMU